MKLILDKEGVNIIDHLDRTIKIVGSDIKFGIDDIEHNYESGSIIIKLQFGNMEKVIIK